MFTVKHRAEDGTETLYSAERVEVVQEKGQYVDGIYLDWPQADPTPPDAPAAARPPAKHVIAITTPYRAAPPPQVAGDPAPRPTWVPRVWVMNEGGATVATYDL
jgi:hypothetical protein